jgi:hypothetical protein
LTRESSGVTLVCFHSVFTLCGAFIFGLFGRALVDGEERCVLSVDRRHGGGHLPRYALIDNMDIDNVIAMVLMRTEYHMS